MPKISFDKLMAIIFLIVGLLILTFCYHMFLITHTFNIILAIPCISGIIMIVLSILIFRMKDE